MVMVRPVSPIEKNMVLLRNILIRYTGYTKMTMGNEIIKYRVTNQVNIGLVRSNPNPSIATQSAALCQYDP
jgi:hypothetical protein